jgi:hypothetical protein
MERPKILRSRIGITWYLLVVFHTGTLAAPADGLCAGLSGLVDVKDAAYGSSRRVRHKRYQFRSYHPMYLLGRSSI